MDAEAARERKKWALAEHAIEGLRAIVVGFPGVFDEEGKEFSVTTCQSERLPEPTQTEIQANAIEFAAKYHSDKGESFAMYDPVLTPIYDEPDAYNLTSR